MRGGGYRASGGGRSGSGMAGGPSAGAWFMGGYASHPASHRPGQAEQTTTRGASVRTSRHGSPVVAPRAPARSPEGGSTADGMAGRRLRSVILAGNTSVMPDWSDYQDDVADFFRSLGLQAETNLTLQGVRTSHDIDVVARSEHVGFSLLWVIECKSWRRRVSKVHVLALREIVADLGADRGLLMSESGHQRGALEAAKLTNVQVTSLKQLKESSSNALGVAALRAIQGRIDECNNRYWDLDKFSRIRTGLRPSVYETGYSGYVVLRAVDVALNTAFRGDFPVVYCEVGGALLSMTRGRMTYEGSGALRHGALLAKNPSELAAILDPIVSALEKRLDDAYRALAETPEPAE